MPLLFLTKYSKINQLLLGTGGDLYDQTQTQNQTLKKAEYCQSCNTAADRYPSCSYSHIGFEIHRF